MIPPEILAWTTGWTTGWILRRGVDEELAWQLKWSWEGGQDHEFSFEKFTFKVLVDVQETTEKEGVEYANVKPMVETWPGV